MSVNILPQITLISESKCLLMSDCIWGIWQAKHEEVQLEYSRLQQQHARLSSDHSQVHQQLTRQLEAFKEQKANEISALEGVVQFCYK